jgi:ferredoxin
MIRYVRRTTSDSDWSTTPKSIGRFGLAPIRWDSRKQAIKQKTQLTSIWRIGTQAFFVLLSLWMGWQFLRFVEAARDPRLTELPFRPPGVEGYLPISGLMGALDWINQGVLNSVHPAATVLFLLFVLLSLIFRKSFCGWICPVGFLSETLARFGRWLFGANLKPPKWLDILLRSLKYLLLGFFGWAIFTMSAEALSAFIHSPYNKVSDIKMLHFFLDLSRTGILVIGFLAAMSVLVEGFWCRYLCPYGALMGLVSWMSPVKVRRNPETCTDCGICDKVCPARLPVMAKRSITSVECIGCTDCVSSCPVPGALRFGTKRRTLNTRTIALVVIAALIVTTSAARLFGIWQNDLTDAEVKHHVARMDGPGYGHPGMDE